MNPEHAQAARGGPATALDDSRAPVSTAICTAAENVPAVSSDGLRVIDLANAQPIPNSLPDQADFSVPADVASEVDELLTHYPHKRSASLMILHLFQERFGLISRQAVEWTAARLELQPINIYELVTFYPMFTRSKVGTYHFKICRTLSCALGGSYKLHHFFCQKLGLKPHQHGLQTTRDGKFTVEFVECLASCGTAPVLMCNDRFYEGVTEEKANQLLSNPGE